MCSFTVGDVSVLRRLIASVIICSFSIGFATDASAETILHVSPQGNDNWSGTSAEPNETRTDGPVASLAGARDLIRKLKAPPRSGPIRVIIADGSYQLTETLLFEPQDSGTAAAPVIYSAAPGARPIFSGGRQITGWTVTAEGLWTTHIPEVANGEWTFSQLWVNTKHAPRARTPNEFFHYMVKVTEETTGAKPNPAVQTIEVRSEDIKSLQRLTSEELSRVELLAFHKWDNTLRPLEGVDFDKSTLKISGTEMKKHNLLTKNTGYILSNYRAALDEPGEWFLAQDGTLTYFPRPGETIENAVVIAPVIENLLVIKGEPANDRFVSHLHFQGLTFAHSRWTPANQRFGPMQAAAQVDASVQIDGARDVQFENCEIREISKYAIWFRKGCQNCRVFHSVIEELGAGGVRIGEMGIAKNPLELTGHITIENNIIRHAGRLLPCAVGVWIGHSGNNQVIHNEIADMYYTGISVGWRWGYAESLAKNNKIDFNHVHQIGLNYLSDMGAIYTLGPSEGTTVSHNVVHDVSAWSYGGWGLYNDEGSTDIIMEKNLVYHTKTGSYHQHYGRENIIRNNIFAFSKLQQVQRSREEDHLSFTFEKNIVYWDTGALLANRWKNNNFLLRNNLYWRINGQPFDFYGKSFQEWQQTGQDKGSLIADPLFVDPMNGNFHLRPDSPASKIGFEEFDYSQAGVTGDEAWKQRARDVQYPAMKSPPEPLK
ncbi:MAG TPA: right-handed parallel beta-helix repeat-containing protein [Planctomicrobium sp.]|nr:right-handed parallel beta-helix repeat-containing protein [Planctomicrobium sp.]